MYNHTSLTNTEIKALPQYLADQHVEINNIYRFVKRYFGISKSGKLSQKMKCALNPDYGHMHITP